MGTCSGFFPIFVPLCLILTLWSFNHVISIFKLWSENLTSNNLHSSLIKFNELVSGLNVVWCMMLLFAKDLPSKSTLQIWEKRFHHNHAGFLSSTPRICLQELLLFPCLTLRYYIGPSCIVLKDWCSADRNCKLVTISFKNQGPYSFFHLCSKYDVVSEIKG